MTTRGAARATLLGFRRQGTDHVQIAAILDARTCLACLQNDGRILSLGEALLEQLLPCRDCTCRLLNDSVREAGRAKCRCRYVAMTPPPRVANVPAEVKTGDYREQLKSRLIGALTVRR